MDTVTFPETFTPGFMGFETELAFMLDFAASMRDSGLKNYPTTYAALVAKQGFKRSQPTNFVPTIVKPSEGGDKPNGGNGNAATYEGPKDLNYTRDHEKKFGKAPGTRSGRGFVHAMSDAQKKFVLSLLKTKDTSELSTRMVRGWTLDPSQIDTISKQHAIPFIDALKACPNKSVVITPTDSAEKEIKGSDKQINWITKTLIPERNLTESDIKALYIRCNYYASNIISELLAMPKASKKAKEESKTEELVEGIYTDDVHTYKAYVSQDGSRLLCKALIEETHEEKIKGGFKTFEFSWEYAGMAMRFIKLPAFRLVTGDEAKHYGRISGQCCRCGRRLTDETSVENGIGPECSKKI
jgi:hypothetical protein